MSNREELFSKSIFSFFQILRIYMFHTQISLEFSGMKLATPPKDGVSRFTLRSTK